MTALPTPRSRALPQDLRLSHEGLRRVLEGDAYADLWLRGLRRRESDAALRARVERRVLGVLERYFGLRTVLDARLSKPLDTLPWGVQIPLLLGLWRLEFEDSSPAHAVVSSAVEAVRSEGARWATGLVNAVLRGLIRDPLPPAEAELPSFWHRSLARVLPADELEEAARGLRRNPGLHVVLDPRLPAGPLRRQLAEEGCQPVETIHPQVVRIGDGAALFASAAWAQGRVSVQDLGIAAWLTKVAEGSESPLWDAFCAPGGKFLGLQAARPDWWLVGSDRRPGRLGLVRREAARRGLPAPRLFAADATNPPWSASRRFATILADMPCSGSGTLPRHPEIAIRLEAEDLPRLAALQLEGLKALAPHVQPGGRLWYSTCSVFPEENEDVVAAFLAAHPAFAIEAQVHPLDGGAAQDWLRFWPHRHHCAGFSAVALRRDEHAA